MNNYINSALANVQVLKTIRANKAYDVFSNLELTQVQLEAALEIISEQAFVIASWIRRDELDSVELATLIHNSVDFLTLDIYSILGKK